MALKPGTRLGPYEIQAQVGSGGMGAVYKAFDSRLQRVVAIKQLPPEHARWFSREARAIAAVNHPHICQVYDVGADYLVLEYVEGHPATGRLLPDEVVHLALQLVDGLGAAHARGILHRDIKPANILVTMTASGQRSAKLLDFGIAHVTTADATATETGTLGVFGTPAYMSPEQADGKPLDQRSDMFSLGAVLYEWLTGRRAFPGESTGRVISAVLRDDVAPFEAPPGLQQIVRRCLAKNPDDRFPTMSALKEALQDATRQPQDANSVDMPRAIAVLPLASLAADKDSEYFADGLTEEIINALSHVAGLRVIARTSVFAFKGRHEDVRRIAETLGVTHVLEGSVRRSGERVRVTVQLVAAADGSHLWSERYERTMTDVFAMQDEISGAIASALEVRIGAPAARPRRHTPRLRAYEPFLRGRHHLIRFSPDAWDYAKPLFERAIAEDPSYAEPHAELALGYFIAGMHGLLPFRDVAPMVRAEANRALALEPGDLRPRFLLGGVDLAMDYNWSAGREHFEAVMALPQVPPEAHWVYASLYLGALARFDESSEEMRRAVEQDPLNAVWRSIWSAHLQSTGRKDRAVEEAERAVALDDSAFVTHSILAEVYSTVGRHLDARVEAERAYRLAPWSALAGGILATTLTYAGDHARAEQVIRDMGPDSAPGWGRLMYHLHASQIDAAADWFEQMIERRDPFALVYANTPIMAPLRAHPRWAQLAAMMKLPVSV